MASRAIWVAEIIPNDGYKVAIISIDDEIKEGSSDIDCFVEENEIGPIDLILEIYSNFGTWGVVIKYGGESSEP